MCILDKREEDKRRNREHELMLIKEKKISALELGKKNFCMKGVDLHSLRVARNQFNIF